MTHLITKALPRAALICLAASSLAPIAHADESLALFFANDYAAPESQVRSGPRVHIGFARHGENGMLGGVYAPLAEKAREIADACGSSVISGVRHTRVAGSSRMSEHASGHAVDLRGNPSCIYAQLQGWAGGYSTDYGRVQHVHISLGGREDGLRFAHHGGGRTHYAGLHRHHRHYAGLHHRRHYAHYHGHRYANAA